MLGIIFAALLVSAPAEARRGHHVRPVRVHQHHHGHHHPRAVVLRPAVSHAAPHGLTWIWNPGHYNHRHVWIRGHWDLRIRL